MFLVSKKDKKVENDDVSIIIKSLSSRLAKARGQLGNSNEGQFRVLQSAKRSLTECLIYEIPVYKRDQAKLEHIDRFNLCKTLYSNWHSWHFILGFFNEALFI